MFSIKSLKQTKPLTVPKDGDDHSLLTVHYSALEVLRRCAI